MATPEAAAPPPQVRLGILGYGEVGHGLALGLRKAGLASIAAFQRTPHSPLTLERAQASGVRLVGSAEALADCADVVIAVTQGRESLAAARAICPGLSARHCYVDLASAAPSTKRQIAELLEGTGAAYADGVIEGSPLEHEHRLPILVSGPGASRFAGALNPWQMRIAVAGAEVGRAAAIKGLRHILMKGQIALLLEGLVAARRAGIQDEVLVSVAEWYDALPFTQNATRLVRTTIVHARRRAEEAAMARDIALDLGIDPIMTRATVATLEKVAALGLRESTGGVLPASLDAAIDLICEHWVHREETK